MEEVIKELVRSLTEKTKQNLIKWSDGTEEGEFYAHISDKSILYHYDAIKNEYKLSLLNEVGVLLFGVTITLDDNTLFSNAEELYRCIINLKDDTTQTLKDFITTLDGNKNQ